ncbi:MAG: ATP-binding protein [Burkholderiales bacterium]
MDSLARPRPVQRIVKVRRDYNRWVADETLEDYALRFAPRGFRKWSAFRVANTAFGAVSFLALEAIGAAISLTYGFTNAIWAIAVVSAVIFLTGLPISVRAARQGLDMDLLARGAGFGYLGSTITSLIYASFTFIFFALEAAIMAQAFELWFDIPRPVGYVISALVEIPMVTHGVTPISRLQLWTQPAWLLLLVLPYVAIWLKDPEAFRQFASLNGRAGDGDVFSWTAFGAAATVAASLIAQIGEQVDFLRFMPEPTKRNRVRWWCAVVIAGPGWIVLGAAKMVGGAFLAFLALQNQVPVERALEPTQMYLAGFAYVVGAGGLSVALTSLFVIVSQVKINVTNAYAGSLAWSNFFARLTHSHPGRVVWLVFNVAIAVLLMVMGVFEALDRVLAFYAHLAVAWVGAIVGDLVIAKPLGLSPERIEFRRAYLHDINPAGFGAMGLGSVLSVAAYAGLFGEPMRAASAGIALVVSMAAEPLIAWATGGRWFIAREPVDFGPRHRTLRCAVCRNRFESDDMAQCPAYGGPICSLCCTLDARCGDRCKGGDGPHRMLDGLLTRLLPTGTRPSEVRRVGRFAGVLTVAAMVFGAMLWLLYTQERLHLAGGVTIGPEALDLLFLKIAAALLLIAAVAAWWLVLAAESRQVAQQESERQNQLLQREIDAHRQTDALLAHAKEVAEGANLAKSRFLTGMSHEMRAPLNSILGYSQLLLRDAGLDAGRRDSVDTILRSGEHLASLVDGLLELSRIEHGKLRIDARPTDLGAVLAQVARMFEPLAEAKGLGFRHEVEGPLPARVNADPKRLRQVLINLLSNAVKFTHSGSVTLRVRHAREIGHIDVIDTGMGVAAADQDRIFRPFERLAPASVEGTGLGLTITQLLVELMGGDIRVRSEPGRGSCFQVRVYLPSVAGAPEPQADARIVGYEGARRRVLVVDDEPAHRAVLRRMLEPLGFAVDEADGARACLDAAERGAFDLVLLDVELPDGRGWQVCEALRARGGHARVGVLMVSGNAHEATEAKRALHGADGFVAKPVIEADLLAAVGTCLGLDWRRAAPGVDDDAEGAGPSADAVRELLALAAGGYPRALRARLAELAQESAASAAWVARIASLLESDPQALAAALGQVLREPARA